MVGDIVDFEVQNTKEGYIHHVHDRNNELKRPPVSNIDELVIVMSAVEPEFFNTIIRSLFSDCSFLSSQT